MTTLSEIFDNLKAQNENGSNESDEAVKNRRKKQKKKSRFAIICILIIVQTIIQISNLGIVEHFVKEYYKNNDVSCKNNEFYHYDYSLNKTNKTIIYSIKELIYFIDINNDNVQNFIKEKIACNNSNLTFEEEKLSDNFIKKYAIIPSHS